MPPTAFADTSLAKRIEGRERGSRNGADGGQGNHRDRRGARDRRAFCRTLAGEGAKVVLCDIDNPAAAADSIQRQGGEALAITADATSAESMAQAVATAVNRFGRSMCSSIMPPSSASSAASRSTRSAPMNGTA